MLEINKLSCGYEDVNVIKDISINLEKQKIFSIIGPNGCGKSTLLKAISHLINYNGSIKLDGVEVSKIKRKELAKKMSIMTQSNFNYFPYTVYETIAMGRYAHMSGLFSSLTNIDKEIILQQIKRVDMMKYKDKLINELSGGQLQRVHLAKTFVQDPDVILFDEPTNHLDLKCQIEILEHIQEWVNKKNKIVITVLHDLNLVQMFSEEVALMNEGEIIMQGKTSDILSNNIINSVYGINIKDFMNKALEKWK